MQVLFEAQLELGDTLGMQDALIQRLAEKDPQFYGEQISGSLTVVKSAAAGAIKDVKFLDTETCFWQLTKQQTMQHKAHTDIIPYLGTLHYCSRTSRLAFVTVIRCLVMPMTFPVQHTVRCCRLLQPQAPALHARHQRVTAMQTRCLQHRHAPMAAVDMCKTCRQDQGFAWSPLAGGGM